MANASIPSGFLKTTLKTGVGRYVCQLKRITLMFCKEEAKSSGMRGYIEQSLADFSRANPSVAVYAQVKRHKSPKIVAEYLNGNTQEHVVAESRSDEIAQWMDWFRTRSGDDLIRIRKPYHTYTPSIQGTWTPFTNRPSSLNSSKSLLDREQLQAYTFKQSATEIVQNAAADMASGRGQSDFNQESKGDEGVGSPSQRPTEAT